MIISDEQAKLAAQFCAGGPCVATSSHIPVSAEFIAQVHDVVDRQPEIRADRVAEARQRLLSGGTLDCGEVARKMISRIVSDSLR
ncbi:MAG: flagellar biosynthesis anti-sigma factor FlgM [Coriobacteriia bacterium]|nr:flagellar biosynthesis anti-sigma factor FlgM [Coriobacteriia bacterium]